MRTKFRQSTEMSAALRRFQQLRALSSTATAYIFVPASTFFCGLHLCFEQCQTHFLRMCRSGYHALPAVSQQRKRRLCIRTTQRSRHHAQCDAVIGFFFNSHGVQARIPAFRRGPPLHNPPLPRYQIKVVKMGAHSLPSRTMNYQGLIRMQHCNAVMIIQKPGCYKAHAQILHVG